MGRRLLCAWLLLAGLLALAGPPPTLRQALDHLIATTSLKGSPRVGVMVHALADGACWYQHDADKAFVPASNTKIFTAVLALHYLTPDYTFTTGCLADALPAADGTLDGNLYLRGGGDPTLTPQDLAAMARQLAEGDPVRGMPPLRTVRGAILTDDSFFPTNGPVLSADWDADDLPWYYAAPANALSCARNAVKITLRGTHAGEPAEVVLEPPTELFTIENAVITDAAVTKGAIEVWHQANLIKITGRVAPGTELSERISVPYPARMAEEQFSKALKTCGVVVEAHVPAPVPVGAEPVMLLAHTSEPLRAIMVPFLKESDNHIGEQLRWTLLSLQGKEIPLERRYAYLWKQFADAAGIDAGGASLADGCGLSRNNAVLPETITSVLTYETTQPEYNAFFQALPIAGVDGTLGKRCVGSPAQGKVHAKTGTLRGVSALSGYVTTASGDTLVFSIIINHYTSGTPAARALEDAIVGYLAGL